MTSGEAAKLVLQLIEYLQRKELEYEDHVKRQLILKKLYEWAKSR